MTWVKICGITNLDDALVAVDAGADALGFVFYEKSPRNVNVETVREIVAKLPEQIEKVGVFVDDDSRIEASVDLAGLTGIQWYSTSGEVPCQDKAYASRPHRRPIKFYFALPVKVLLEDEQRLQGWIQCSNNWHLPFFRSFLLDAGGADQPGGTGKTFDWKAAAPLVDSMRKNVSVVIAGGLNPSNVTSAIDILRPWGVDVSSGVEFRPGKKDPEKVRAFVQAARQAGKKE